LPWRGGFDDTAGIGFSSRQNDEQLTTEAMYYSGKSLMKFEESHFRATKERLCGCNIPMGQGFLTIQEYHFQAAKMPKC
jgi:hypothetical protein